MWWRIFGSSRGGSRRRRIEFDDWGASWGRALFVWVDKGGFMFALGSGWVGDRRITGGRQGCAVTRVCLCFACVSYEGLFSRRPVFRWNNLTFMVSWS